MLLEIISIQKSIAMKKSTFLNLGKTLVLGFLALSLFSACSSEYHWVKAHSGDPIYKGLADQNSKTVQSAPLTSLSSIQDKPKADLSQSRTPIQDLSNLPVRDHGLAGINKNAALDKAREIEKTLTAERKAALKSTDLKVRTQAFKETLHEQLAKNSAFTKLSTRQQEKLENKLSEKMAAKSYRSGNGLDNFNSLLLVGLILLVLSILFLVIPGISIIGVLFGVVAAVLIILGLVQMLA